MLFSCDFARTVWLTKGLAHVLQSIQQSTAFMVLLTAFETCTREQCVRIGMTSWSLWNRRNKWFWDRVNGTAFGVKAATQNLIQEWRQAQESNQNSRVQIEQGDRVWAKPDADWLKVNIDAAIFQDGSIGVGSVIRDSNGIFVGARSCKLAGAWSPREAEAISMKEVSSWIIKNAYKKCVIETDSKCLVTTCKGTPGEAFFGTLVSYCVHL